MSGKYLWKFAAATMTAALLISGANAQTSATDGTTPASMAPGAGPGTQSLSDFEHINIFNGNLAADFSILHVGGRGKAGYEITLSLERHWRSVNGSYDPFHDGNLIYYSGAESGWWTGLVPGYSPGVVQSRTVADEVWPCDPSVYGGTFYAKTLTRLTFTSPDGSDHELVDVQTNGSPHIFGVCGSANYSRGTVFASNDGSGTIFVADSAIVENNTTYGIYPVTGNLIFADGTRYRVDAGLVTSIRDRNGNQVVLTYGTTPQDPITYNRVISIVDSLDRQVSISYANNTTVFYDQISYKGFNGASRTARIYYASLSQRLRSGYTPQNYRHLFPDYNTGDPNDPNTYNPTVIASLEIPDGRSYQFSYNPYAELARIVLPSGGAVEYDHTPTSGVICTGIDCTTSEVYRRMIERRVYPDGNSATPEGKTTYRDGTNASVNPVTVDRLTASGTLLTRELHYFFGSPVPVSLVPIYWGPWRDGKEYQSEVVSVTNGVAGAVLSRNSVTWVQQAPVSWCTQFGCTADSAPPNNPRVTDATTTLTDVTPNLISKKTYLYDDTFKINNTNSVKEYDFGSGSVGPLVRELRTTYVTSATYTGNSVHIMKLPTQISLYDAAGQEKTRTTYEYDNYAADSNHAALTDRTAISGHNSTYTTSFTARGNVTAVTNYLIVNNAVTGSITAYSKYDKAGNVISSKDARGYTTTFDYTDRFGGPDGNARLNAGSLELNAAGHNSFAFPTLVTNHLGHTTYAQFDYYLGEVVDSEDVNGVVASASYLDTLDRLTQIIRAANQGSSFKSQTTIGYDDGNRVVTTTSDQTTYGDNVLKSQRLFDGLNRVKEIRTFSDATNYSARQQEFDALGRAYRASNPFRPWKSETPAWSTEVFDSLGRVTSASNPDNSTVTTSYNGTQTTVTDQAGIVTTSVFDGLGRLTTVYEGNGAYSTGYVYDVLDNLTSVSQGTQSRTFVYDSLRRMTSVTRPENGTISFTYDNNGNVLTRTDARSITATYAYDPLNRLTSESFSDSTPGVTFEYDTVPSGVGCLKRIYAPSANSSMEVLGYDPLGRITGRRQLFYSNSVWTNFDITYTYDLAGHLKSMAYPSGHVVNYQYESGGRLGDVNGVAAFTGNLGDGVSRNYDSISGTNAYDATNRIQEEKFGTNTALFYKRHYNIRGQLYDIRLSTVPWATDQWNYNRGAIVNWYDTTSGYPYQNPNSGTNNNGNVRRSEVFIPANDQISSSTFIRQNYQYDALNRLLSVNEYLNGTANSFNQAFLYDQYGNRRIDPNGTTQGVGINTLQTAISTATNRLYAVGETDQSHPLVNYDAAGNQTKDYLSTSGTNFDRTYDADNRLISSVATSGSSVTTNYTYDGEGRRVRRKVGSTETWQIYGIDSELLAEYPANASVTSPSKEYGYRNGQLLVVAEPASTSAPAPSTLTAAASGSLASPTVTLNWTAASGATNYRVERKPAGSSYTFAGATASTSFTDTGVTSGAAYLYRVCAANAQNNCTSAFSNTALGSAIIFATDPTIITIVDDPTGVNTTRVKAAHITELRTAVNSVRGLAGLSAASWTNPILTIGVSVISKDDITDLRTKLDEALTTLGIQTSAYADTPLLGLPNGTWIKGIHIRELRLRATSGIGGAGGGGGSTPTVHWLVADHLGTPRMSADISGTLAGITRHDYLPFGEELTTQGGRASIAGYGTNDGVRQKFTSKERDVETGLDYFGARYYSSVLGRFTVTDGGAPDQSDPQSWNRYRYARNNPLFYIDPTGNKDEPAKDNRINQSLATDQALLEVIKVSNNFSQRSFEDNLKKGTLYGNLDKGAGAILRGLCAEAYVLEALRTRVPAFAQPEFPGVGNLLPDILYVIPSGRPRYTVRIPLIGSITIGSDIHWTIDNVATTTGTTTVDLGTNVQTAWVEVKAGIAPSTIMKGAEQVAAYAKGIQLAKLPAVAILYVDTDAWNNLPATTRASALSIVTAAGGYIQLVDGLIKAATERARDTVLKASKQCDAPMPNRPISNVAMLMIPMDHMADPRAGPAGFT
jgi:RHS repeat-associated protein